jgi:hypothetical protein
VLHALIILKKNGNYFQVLLSSVAPESMRVNLRGINLKKWNLKGI